MIARDEAGRDALVGVEVVAAVDVDGAATINHDLVEIAGQAAQIDMINQRAIGLLPQQSLFLAGDDQQPAVGQPIDRERDRAGHLGDHLTMTIEIERKNLRGAPVRQPQAAVVPAGGFSDNKVIGQEARFGHKGHLFSGVPSARGCIPVSMNSGQEASPDRPTAEATDAAEDADTVDSADAADAVDPGDASDAVDPAEAAEGGDADDDPESEALQRSQDAIDEGREAAREALQDNPPDADPSAPGASES